MMRNLLGVALFSACVMFCSALPPNVVNLINSVDISTLPRNTGAFKSICDESGFKVDFVDDFDGPTLNSKVWALPGEQDPKQRLSCGKDAYCQRMNVAVNNGKATIFTHREPVIVDAVNYSHTSGFLTTVDKKTWKKKDHITRFCVTAKHAGTHQQELNLKGLTSSVRVIPSSIPSCDVKEGEIRISDRESTYISMYTCI